MILSRAQNRSFQQQKVLPKILYKMLGLSGQYKEMHSLLIFCIAKLSQAPDQLSWLS
jgi:hypothetical protein